MAELTAVAVITVLAVISPGADFAMIVRNSCLYGRTAGLLAAAGIGLGVLVHVSYTVLGVGLLLSGTPAVLTAVRIAGACYLVWIGWQTFRSRVEVDTSGGPGEPPPRGAALRTGFLTNALNPKTMLFVVSTYTQVVDAGTPFLRQAGYGLFMSLAHLVWFGLVAGVLSAPALRTRLLRGQVPLNRAIGAVLVALGISLALAPA
ncbi:LysE family translocator [Streptomyces chilikensis]|uniref:LysE family translocator n=1 Tax=Streptomyces chilikensis TaxID=1194079 RepID=A0ABV3EIC1_9ACTN